MAHKKAGGSTTLGRDSQSQRLGVKKSDGEYTKAGSILIRQRGSKFHIGKNVMRGGDDTLFATINGFVKFTSRKKRAFTGKLRLIKIVSVIPSK